MTGPVEWLVGLVLGVDALVIAGILVSRLTGRSRRRNGDAAADERAASDRFQTYAASDRADSTTSSEMAATAVAEPTTDSTAEYEALADIPSDDMTDAPAGDLADAPAGDMLDASAEAATDSLESTDATHDALESTEATIAQPEAEATAAAATDWDAAVADTPAIPERAQRPVGLDFGPTWIDPVAMAAEAAAEWRRGLRRDLALAAWRGRPGLVMNLKLDVESEPELSISEVARCEAQLHEAIRRSVRATDHFDRTGPGRFHVILSEMPESAALAVAERIRHGFADSAGLGSPRLLIGWAAMEGEGDIAVALQRAAERLDGLAAAGPTAQPAQTLQPEQPAAPESSAADAASASPVDEMRPPDDASAHDGTVNGRAWPESPAEHEV